MAVNTLPIRNNCHQDCRQKLDVSGMVLRNFTTETRRKCLKNSVLSVPLCLCVSVFRERLLAGRGCAWGLFGYVHGYLVEKPGFLGVQDVGAGKMPRLARLDFFTCRTVAHDQFKTILVDPTQFDVGVNRDFPRVF